MPGSRFAEALLAEYKRMQHKELEEIREETRSIAEECRIDDEVVEAMEKDLEGIKRVIEKVDIGRLVPNHDFVKSGKAEGPYRIPNLYWLSATIDEIAKTKTTGQIFEAVAARIITPEHGAKIMIEQRRQERARLPWFMRWLLRAFDAGPEIFLE